jgi:uncharacterized repeat protein (TIGR03837 family)
MIAPALPTPDTALRWDLFCQVIDNYGDIGVCWRLAAELGARGHRVRLWVDDASALQWMAPQALRGEVPGVEVRPWPLQAPADGPGDVVVEAFGCEIAPDFIASIADRARTPGQKPLWINLEYLSAEDYVERCHRLPSRLMSGPGAGLTRWFFYPGFTPATGGLLRERDLTTRQAAFDRPAWRARQGLAAQQFAVSLFSYEPPALPQLLTQLAAMPAAQLLVTPGRAAQAVHALEQSPSSAPMPALQWLAPCPQPAFDELLWGCDFNCVRGEDSLVRALWAGQPFVWHIYPQHDDAHHAKLDAFLDWLQPPAAVRRFFHVWNGMAPRAVLPALDDSTLTEWRACTLAGRTRLLAQQDLLTQLLGFAAEKS